MGRLITFVVGILVGVALKWQYDQQQSNQAPAAQTTGRMATPSQSSGEIQEIAITVEESNRAATTPPTQPTENRASPLDGE